MNEEIWKEISGYDGRYEVSNFGRVTSHQRIPSIILKANLSVYGYPTVYLSRMCKKKTISVHLLVARAFLAYPDEGVWQVDHKDFNKKNNHISNLHYVSQKENIVRGWEGGQRERHRAVLKNLYQKISHQSSIEISKELACGKKLKDLARKYNVSMSTISLRRNYHVC